MKAWTWVKVKYEDGEGRELVDGRGRNRASVWPNGVWHTFDPHGVGGENDSCSTVQDAMDQAVAAVVRQGWTPFKLAYAK